MFPSSLNQLNLEERKAHAELMVIIASIDGELVQEELMMIESLMGSCMLHPEMRVDIRNMLNNPPEFDKTVSVLSETALKLALRDGALLSAVDGEYDKKELRILSAIAKKAGVEKETMSKLFEWVEHTLNLYNECESILSL
ncbi:MAG: TerB family tellurite resistance protein [Euryarchaeota archaeon]|nr:TerB family tellurite resistance protein [Euryarchaeota archaeon]MBT4924242.1 TerB family tellurite resistance protein [Euryarchaeota archaeon]MBT7460450.1 TerB family tellurite resistance protein [Euryarchaeota archaeon]